MNASHTPGPWTLSPNGHYVRYEGTHGPNICALNFFGGPDEEAKANALLLCAAPELLAALKELWESARCEPVGKDGKDCWLVSVQALNRAQNAIAHAEGRS